MTKEQINSFSLKMETMLSQHKPKQPKATTSSPPKKKKKQMFKDRQKPEKSYQQFLRPKSKPRQVQPPPVVTEKHKLETRFENFL